MEKTYIYKAEIEKLTEIFNNVDESKRKLVEGLIQDAAFLKTENQELKNLLKETGMIKIHPTNKGLQKQVPAAKQYLQNLNSYAIVIRTLNSVLSKDLIEEDDNDLEEFE